MSNRTATLCNRTDTLRIRTATFRHDFENGDLFTDIGFGNIQYGFITGNDITCAAKSPMGVFEDKIIPNDLAFVFEAIDKYENEE